MAKKVGAERRRSPRTLIQESFNFFLVLPETTGMVRIYMKDISSVGVSFRTEVEGNFKQGDSFKARLYMSPTFFIPLECKVVRVKGVDIAVEFPNAKSPAALAIAKLQEFLEAAEEVAVMVE